MVRTNRLPAGVAEALRAAGGAAKRALGDPALAELVMIRASQINRCAFCLDMHLALARSGGESGQRLDLLASWAEAEGLYTARERAALALAESVTVLTEGYVPDAVYEEAAEHFDEAELAGLIAVITVINTWNRLMVARRIPPGGKPW
ncbi:Carboxymuconolactone decarboxylase family protein [Streptomyces sp. YIM 130001]|uniref:carboxymuconolactone decarboxylase family protein n=1 Tax=Streptomyces sp. YIM 130001 TaxID=2259644 RepID=UPI000EEEED1C|nr:carboxymuconolactone decarboxylase family protein [Streptomyces sp. YIM 130001]RII21092.1 Carboxymuconolactone decarboxylase family protein [Streptomyces sp. YIM 130001]